MKPKPAQFFDDEIEPSALCRNCEYFEGGGLKADGNPVRDRGDCGNIGSPRSIVGLDDTCNQFFPCNTRWPEADHG